MRVLAISSQKGGSGKTTLAGHIAVQAQKMGAGPVALVDTDPQGSLADWWNERQDETPVFVSTYVSRLAADIERMRDAGIKLLVVDTPPAITDTIADVVHVSDLIIIPTRPSPHDLRAAGATVELVENLGKPLIFVINAATPRARMTSDAACALSQHGTVAPVIIHHRADFAASMIDGRTVMEVSKAARAASEITKLWEYIDARLISGRRKTIMPSSTASVIEKPSFNVGVH
ncbi:AAA family ATPase [Pelagibius sp. Alg239-R121]|uniref:nucleotide-binding protein n=1 Tax=Pelagibius sp. Alg239-R121 TaxID=2993448 RepID=UPI0024A6D6D2|nr:AAA family ATPase [Pelagibius sp. Alg239-R121]